MRRAILVLAVLAMAGCDAITYPPRSYVYDPAVEGLKGMKNLPAGAVVDPRKDAQVFIAKNAGQALIDVDYKDASGKTVTDTYAVHMKRINRRWAPESFVLVPKGDAVPTPSPLAVPATNIMFTLPAAPSPLPPATGK